jgi:hypothetical protein
MPRPVYREGDHWTISDKTGRQIRASDSVKEWNGALVAKDEFEPRHPQDFVRSKGPDSLSVEDARPQPVDVFIGPLLTNVSGDTAAGSITLAVNSAARMRTTDKIWVLLDNGDTHRTTIASISVNTLTLATPLPWSAAAGNLVTDVSAIAQSSIGTI